MEQIKISKMADINQATSIITFNVNDSRLQNKSVHLKGFKIQNIFFDINGIKLEINRYMESPQIFGN